MRLLKVDQRGDISLTKDLLDNIPPYAILSHTWGAAEDEVTYDDIRPRFGNWWNRERNRKPGYAKVLFCARQAQKDGLEHFWVDTCCINKANLTELSEAITSMFKWYQRAVKCYVYLSDVSIRQDDTYTQSSWESRFRNSRWFTRGWTLQELLSPRTVEFFTKENEFLGTKKTLEGLIHMTTQIPIPALRGTSLSQFSTEERLRWTDGRDTTKVEDRAYCLFGIFGIFLPLIYGEGENAFERLKEEIEKHSGEQRFVALRAGSDLLTISALPSISGAHTHWMVTRSTNPFFIGRDDILQDLEQTIRDARKQPSDQAPCRIVISGMGGLGKSEICLQLAHRLRRLFWGVFWIDVSTDSLAERSFLDVAEMISQPAQVLEDALISISNLKQPWLIVLDNADDPDLDYQRYFPTGTIGVVVLTSRNEECQRYTTTRPITLEGLSEEEAQRLLLKAALVPLDQYGELELDAKKVARLLQSHPLAVIQAGAYISRGHCTLIEYPLVFEQQRKRLLEFRPRQAKSRYQDVYATFEASAILLKASQTEVARDALEILPLLAVCGPNRVSSSLFEAAWNGSRDVPPGMADDAEDNDVSLLTPWHIARLPSLIRMPGRAWDAFRLVEAVNLLKAFALVSTESHNRCLSVSMHPLVHAWARDRQNDLERHQSWLQMGCVFAFVSQYDIDRRQLEQQLYSHLETVVQWDIGEMFAKEPPVLIARVLIQCGFLLSRYGRNVTLLAMLEKMFDHLQLDPEVVTSQWLGIYALAGSTLLEVGRVTTAIALLEEVVRIQRQLLNEDHLHRLISEHELARGYISNGETEKAMKILEEVVRIQKQSLREDHPQRLMSEHALASAYVSSGETKKAIAMLQDIVKIQKRSLNEDHPHRLATEHDLASGYLSNGETEKAMGMFQDIVRIQKQSLDEDHPHRLISEHELAVAYASSGETEKAIALLAEVVRIQKQSLNEDNAIRIVSEHELAKAYLSNGETERAIALFEEVVRKNKALKEDDMSRLASEHELARAYNANGQLEKAIATIEEVVRIQKHSLTEDHHDRLMSEQNLAIYLWDDGRQANALDVMMEVTRIRRKILDEAHPDRQFSEEWLTYMVSKVEANSLN